MLEIEPAGNGMRTAEDPIGPPRPLFGRGVITAALTSLITWVTGATAGLVAVFMTSRLTDLGLPEVLTVPSGWFVAGSLLGTAVACMALGRIAGDGRWKAAAVGGWIAVLVVVSAIAAALSGDRVGEFLLGAATWPLVGPLLILVVLLAPGIGAAAARSLVGPRD